MTITTSVLYSSLDELLEATKEMSVAELRLWCAGLHRDERSALKVSFWERLLGAAELRDDLARAEARAHSRTGINHLYRIYDENDTLLYVGISFSVMVRLSGHKDKPWWSEVRTIKVENFETREAVEAAEHEAIRRERPLHNIKP